MNINPFRRRFEPDMDAMEEDMREPLPPAVQAYARRVPIKIEDAIEEHVKSFMDVPMQEIDRLEASLREETETTFEYGQNVPLVVATPHADFHCVRQNKIPIQAPPLETNL